jgi:hypothetical protein
MNKELIKKNTEIAIGLLASSIPDRFGNGKMNHNHRTYISKTVTTLLEMILQDIDKSDDVIIPKKTPTINPPDES